MESCNLILVRPMSRVLVLLIFAGCVLGCATEEERYQWNRTHVFLCPSARRLTKSDLDEIARLVAHSTSLVASRITTPAYDHSLRKIIVYTVARGAEGTQNPDLDGAVDLEHDSTGWHVTDAVTGVSPGLWAAMGCE
jgi:hypothetical protein